MAPYRQWGGVFTITFLSKNRRKKIIWKIEFKFKVQRNVFELYTVIILILTLKLAC